MIERIRKLPRTVKRIIGVSLDFLLFSIMFYALRRLGVNVILSALDAFAFIVFCWWDIYMDKEDERNKRRF